jgi:UDP-hydrolysing UDP-N-acetyl-D-glucosamine 2-epimerase
MKKSKILYVSGSRSEYYFMKPILKAIQASDIVELQLILVGQLCESEGDSTRFDIVHNFTTHGHCRTLPVEDDKHDRSEGLSHIVNYVTERCRDLKPDIIMATGDREEPLASAIVGAYLNIPVIHYCGGGITMGGTADDKVRDAISALSDIHLTLSRHEADRLSGMGYSNIHVVGHAGIDRFLDYAADPIKEGIYCVCIFHPLFGDGSNELEKLLNPLLTLGIDIYVGSPNTDPGNKSIIETINKYAAQYPQIKSYGTISDVKFISMIRGSQFLIGNSSAGVLEIPAFGVPVINILPRQLGRVTCGDTVSIPMEEDKIILYAKNILNNPRPNIMQSTIYGDFKAVEKIMQVLEAKGSKMRQGNLQ